MTKLNDEALARLEYYAYRVRWHTVDMARDHMKMHFGAVFSMQPVFIHPCRTHAAIHAAVSRAFTRRDEFKPFSLGLPARLELDFADTAMAERVSMVPTAERLALRTVAFPCEDYLQMMKNLMVATALAKSVIDSEY